MVLFGHHRTRGFANFFRYLGIMIMKTRKGETIQIHVGNKSERATLA